MTFSTYKQFRRIKKQKTRSTDYNNVFFFIQPKRFGLLFLNFDINTRINIGGSGYHEARFQCCWFINFGVFGVWYRFRLGGLEGYVLRTQG